MATIRIERVTWYTVRTAMLRNANWDNHFYQRTYTQSWAYTLMMVVGAVGYHKTLSTHLLICMGGAKRREIGWKSKFSFLSSSFPSSRFPPHWNNPSETYNILVKSWVDKFVNGKTLERFGATFAAICTTICMWPSFSFNCPLLLFITSTQKLLVSYQFYPKRIVLSCFYLLTFHLEKFSTWIWRLQSASIGLWTDDCNQLGCSPINLQLPPI